MDVLWGAFVKDVVYNEKANSYDIHGIYDTIYKEKKSDYPFFVDLAAVIVFQAQQVEYERTYNLTLELIDIDGVNHIFELNDKIQVPSGDSPQRWYETYELKGVGFDEPNQYSLSIQIDGQQKQEIPLWVISPKGMIIDEKHDIKTEFWPEDLKQARKENDLGSSNE